MVVLTIVTEKKRRDNLFWRPDTESPFHETHILQFVQQLNSMKTLNWLVKYSQGYVQQIWLQRVGNRN